MKQPITAVVIAGLVTAATLTTEGHDFSKNPVTWNREISRIVYDRCASCHREGGSAFSLMTYQEARPRAEAIGEAVLSRRMPPWGAVKGFGDFRNDQSLTQEQIELVAAWVDGYAPRGNNPNVLPEIPRFAAPVPFQVPPRSVRVTGPLKLRQAIVLDGVVADKVPTGRSPQVIAALPDGSITPLVWLYEYRDRYKHPFLLRKPIELPAGTVIKGVKAPMTLYLLPANAP